MTIGTPPIITTASVAAVAATIPPPSVISKPVYQRVCRHVEQLLSAMAIADELGIDYSDLHVSDCGQLRPARDAIRSRISAVRDAACRERKNASARARRATARA